METIWSKQGIGWRKETLDDMFRPFKWELEDKLREIYAKLKKIETEYTKSISKLKKQKEIDFNSLSHSGKAQEDMLLYKKLKDEALDIICKLEKYK